MMYLKYLILSIVFAQVLYYYKATGDSLLEEQISLKSSLIPNCNFSVDMIGFFLYTRNIPDGIIISEGNLSSIDEFNKLQTTSSIIFLIHGFLSNPNDTNFINLINALLDKEDFFILSVDWRKGACTPSTGRVSPLNYLTYPTAVKNAALVGKYVAEFTKTLVEKYKVQMSNIRIIGHSLGAQVSGIAGKQIQKSNLNYSEIIGLDPSGVFYRFNTCQNRICETDAEYVQILHTSNKKGTTKRLGTIDFYMNYGANQPGCNFDESCSHARAIEYFTECVKRECCLIGTPWINSRVVKPLSQCTKETCVCVGLNAKKYASIGSFYVPVEANPPYCHNEGIRLEL